MTKQTGKERLGALALVALSVLFSTVSSLIILPKFIAHYDGFNLPVTDQLKQITDIRSNLLQLFGGIGAAITIYFTWRNFVRASLDAADSQQRNLEARISNDYVQAVQQLGNDSPAVRAGGALGLGRLLRAVPEGSADYWAIMDVLTTFVRDRASIRTKGDPSELNTKLREGARTKGDGGLRPSADIEAAINVLARRSHKSVPDREEDSPVDLSECDLTGAWMDGARFSGGKYSGAFFGRSRLIDTDFNNSYLERALFDEADLANASFRGAYISGANFTNARNVDSADFTGAFGIGEADFTDKQRAAILKPEHS